MQSCPCCTNVLIRQICNGHLNWFCRHCWANMPVGLQVNANVSMTQYVVAAQTIPERQTPSRKKKRMVVKRLPTSVRHS